MRTVAMLAGVGFLLTAGAPCTAQAQLQPTAGPSFQEVTAAWNGFWSAVILGDLAGARKYVHSHRQHMFPGNLTVEELQDMARQMAYCRLDPTPFPLRQDEVIYRVHCQHGGETAETQVGVRRDFDGAWRFSVL